MERVVNRKFFADVHTASASRALNEGAQPIPPWTSCVQIRRQAGVSERSLSRRRVTSPAERFILRMFRLRSMGRIPVRPHSGLMP